MASEEVIMEVAMNFYENKDLEKFLEEAKEKGVPVTLHEDKKGEYIDYLVGGIVHAVLFCKPGKPIAVTIRPVV